MSAAEKPLFGVYHHAFWLTEDQATGAGRPVLTGGGHVVREVTAAVPYGRMTPLRTFKRRNDAVRYSDRLESTCNPAECMAGRCHGTAPH